MRSDSERLADILDAVQCASVTVTARESPWYMARAWPALMAPDAVAS
jgi:hypothetical protein